MVHPLRLETPYGQPVTKPETPLQNILVQPSIMMAIYVHDFWFWHVYLGFLKLGCFGSANMHPWMFLPLDILFEYWIEHVTLGLLYVLFRFSTWIFYRRVADFGTHFPCGNWCRGSTTCLLYIGPRFRNLLWNDSGFVNLTSRRTTFSFFFLLILYVSIYIHFDVSQSENFLFTWFSHRK